MDHAWWYHIEPWIMTGSMPTHSTPAACCWVQALKPGSTTQLDINTLEAVAGDAPTATLGRDTVVGQPLVRAGRSCACQVEVGGAGDVRSCATASAHSTQCNLQ